jgi:hypothetical protein
MPIVFGQQANSVEEVLVALREHGDRVREVYRTRYVWTRAAENPYGAGTTLERPRSMRENPAEVVFPWEQIFLAAATCAGSDYPMLAAHLGVPLDRVELVVEGLFDPRGEFSGLDGYEAPADAAPCYLSLHLRAVVDSTAPPHRLEAIHDRVLAQNMILGALRGIPRTSELVVRATSS